ncbi:MAG TPA: DUF748 domain-containing protein [Cytophagaceae bacterium]|jgi:hypothetical protein
MENTPTNKEHSAPSQKHRKHIKRNIIITVIILLVAFRIALPYIVLKYVNKTLADMGEYSGHVDDIDISLLRGAYTIKEMRVVKKSGKIRTPFYYAPRTELSIEWRALLKGSLVAELEIFSPILNFVAGPTEATSQTSIKDDDWRKTVKQLMPLKLNRFEIQNGEVHYRDFHSEPKVNIYMQNIHALASNLTNSDKLSKTLVAKIEASGLAMKSGQFNLNMDLDPYADQPRFNMDARVVKMHLKELNNFLLAYGKFDVQEGTIGLFVESAAEGGKIKGYVKPLIEDLNVLKPKEEKLKPLRFVYEALVEGVTSVFENQKHDRFATKVEYSGNIKNPDFSILHIIGNVLKNAFIEVLMPRLDGTVNLGDAREDEKGKNDKTDEEKDKEKAEKKAERKREKEQRKTEKDKKKQKK